MKRYLFLLMVIPIIFGATGCMSTPESGQIVVVRNGGPFDNKNIRQIVCPGSGNTWTGWSSTNHGYPDSSSQRKYKLDTSEDADAQPALIRTKDGYNAQITGTFFLKTAFDCSAAGKALVKRFDQQFVNRPASERPWENWGGWLNSTVQPIIDANARKIISTVSCRELVSSCALVGNNAEKVDFKADQNNAQNIQRVEKALELGLSQQLKQQLGADYFKDITFNLQSVQLPEVDKEIAQAQAKFAEVASVNAEVAKAKADVEKYRQQRRANYQRQKGYSACASCARQDELKSLPGGITTLVLGQGSPIALGQK